MLPLGRTNSLGNDLFPGGDGVEKVKQLIQACMAIIENNTTWKDVMKIEPLADDDENPRPKPIYAMTSIEWGAFRDTLAKNDKYWIYGPLRGYASYIFNGYKDSLSWDCSGTLKYTPPCVGCNNCLTKMPEVKRKWAFFIPTNEPQKEVIEIVNPECSMISELCFKCTDFRVQPQNKDGMSVLSVGLGKNKYNYTEFVSEGWRRLNGNSDVPEAVKARTLEIHPLENKSDVVIAIDQEEFEVKPVKVTVLPKMVKFFCKSEVKG